MLFAIMFTFLTMGDRFDVDAGASSILAPDADPPERHPVLPCTGVFTVAGDPYVQNVVNFGETIRLSEFPQFDQPRPGSQWVRGDFDAPPVAILDHVAATAFDVEIQINTEWGDYDDSFRIEKGYSRLHIDGTDPETLPADPANVLPQVFFGPTPDIGPAERREFPHPSWSLLSRLGFSSDLGGYSASNWRVVGSINRTLAEGIRLSVTWSTGLDFGYAAALGLWRTGLRATAQVIISDLPEAQGRAAEWYCSPYLTDSGQSFPAVPAPSTAAFPIQPVFRLTPVAWVQDFLPFETA